MPDIERLRLNVRVLDLLDQSFCAHQDGDIAELMRISAEVNALDAFAVSVITGGIQIGEIPDPERDPQGWDRYRQAARDALAEAEKAAAEAAKES